MSAESYVELAFEAEASGVPLTRMRRLRQSGSTSATWIT